MKTTDPRDPLDRKIDSLLAGRPLKADSDFTARVLAAAEAATAAPAPSSRFSLKLLRFALPVAAAFALALTLMQFGSPHSANHTDPALSTADVQEIFLLQDGLKSLSQLEDDTLGGEDNLLSTLDALYFDLES